MAGWSHGRPAGAAARHRLVAGTGHLQRHRRPEPAYNFHEPVPIVARIVWADDGEEYIETVAAGWTGRDVYVRLPDWRRSLASGGVDVFGARVHETP